MDKWPQPAWAVLLAFLGAILTVVVYIHPGDVTSRQAAFQIASALVTGALGAFAGASHSAKQQGGLIVNNAPEGSGSNPKEGNTP